MSVQDQNLTVMFDGRTLVVECVFGQLMMDHRKLAHLVREAAAGPELRMVAGSIGAKGLLVTTKTFINTDEAEEVVAARMNAMRPRPQAIVVGIVDPKDGLKVWSQLQFMQGN